jgi:hypothetical protein
MVVKALIVGYCFALYVRLVIAGKSSAATAEWE